jgi:alanyl-tRNA synthetase
MKAQEIRNLFSQFFIKHQHQKHKSSGLIPLNDNTILFANAGMNQFKDYFTGKANPENKRAVTIQKVVRAGGKHNDLENVGFTARHHTFFEMLGNFSFGDYFKKDAISFAWKFLTEECKIPKEKLFITVHESDDEAMMIWHKDHGIPLERIFKMGDKSNFWEMGDVGPCGPCTEIFYDHGPKFSTGIPEGGCLLDDEGQFVEIWNLVFMQFEKTYEGKNIVKKSLPKPSVDTGAGLERIAAALQGKYFNYDSDIFAPILNKIESLSGKKYSEDHLKSHFRVVADHIRSATMLITDGALPSNEGRGYVLRRIIRRAIRHLSQLGLKEPTFYKLVPAVFESLGQEYPDNAQNAALAEKLLKLEEEKFRKTLDTGLSLMNDELQKIKPGEKFKGEVAFKLYDTFGFPLDLTEVILREKNIVLDTNGFDEAMKKQKESSKNSIKFQVKEDHLKTYYSLKEKNGETKFLGYSQTSCDAKLIAKIEIDGKFQLVFDSTPFYGESGGQLGDKGGVYSKEGLISTIDDTQKPIDGLHVHLSTDADSLIEGDTYQLKIATNEREATMKNHSATHLLQSALIKVLGPHIKQAGSSVGFDRLRFDFTHSEALKPIELEKVEELVNQAITKRYQVSIQEMNKEQASKKGAMALFGEKYGDTVRVIEMGDFSCELCGGTHVKNTGDIGFFKIISEASLASGVRRIEAISGDFALQYVNHRSKLLSDLEKSFGLKDQKVIEKIDSQQTEIKDLHKKLEDLQHKILVFESKFLFNNFEPLKNNLTLTFVEIKNDDPTMMKNLSEIFVSQYPHGLLFIYFKNQDKLSFILKSSREQKTFDLSAITKPLLPLIEGKGGGKPDQIQGSGKPSRFNDFVLELKKALA